MNAYRFKLILAIAVWLVLMAVILVLPETSEQSGAGRTKNTVRLALAFYGTTAWILLGSSRDKQTINRARLCWSLGWLAYVIHLGFAFHYYHHWSHAEAVERTQRVAGFGPGIYFSHLFTLLWTIDVVWWWLRPDAYLRGPRWVGYGMHGYMIFLIINATLVFGEGLVVPLGVGLLATLGGRAVFQRFLHQPAA